MKERFKAVIEDFKEEDVDEFLSKQSENLLADPRLFESPDSVKLFENAINRRDELLEVEQMVVEISELYEEVLQMLQQQASASNQRSH